MISVIISVFNDETYLKECLDSLVEQTFDEIEVIIVDDCSTDTSLSIINEFCENDSRFRKIENARNMGLPYSLNRALSIATFPLIARLDGDDVCAPERLALQLSFLKANPAIDILGCNAVLVDKTSKRIGATSLPTGHEAIVKHFNRSNPIIHPSVVVRKEVFDQLRGYNERLLRAQDLDLWYRAIKKGFKFENLPDRLLYYRVRRSNSLSSALRGFKVEALHAVKRKSVSGLLYAVIMLFRNIFIFFNLYRPKSMRK